METFDIMLNCAIHIANKVIREDAYGHALEAERAQHRLHDLIEAQDDHDEFLVALARRLGRNRARAVEIQDDVVEIACRNSREFA